MPDNLVTYLVQLLSFRRSRSALVVVSLAVFALAVFALAVFGLAVVTVVVFSLVVVTLVVFALAVFSLVVLLKGTASAVPYPSGFLCGFSRRGTVFALSNYS